jgi:DNA end-binding protein Ku
VLSRRASLVRGVEWSMAPRANWKGYLRLSLVSCPIALYPATSEREKIRFHNLNSETGNRVRMRRVDEETDEEVPYEQVVSGEVGKGQYIEVTDEELEAIALESTRTIDIDTFVPKKEIDQLYNIRPYYIAPEGKVGIDAFAVIRDVIDETDKVALGRVVLTSREHVIALEPRGKGLMGTLLRYPYEVRDEAEYFDDIPAGHVTKEMLDIAKHIVQTKSGHFKPEKFDDHYEEALKELLRKKQAGQKITPAKVQKPTNVVNLMDALRKSVQAEGGRTAAPKRAAASRKSSTKRTSHAKHRKAG